MLEITVLSGKGGTGKTTITASLAALASNTVLCDNDVDASDLHLILDPEVKEIHAFKGAWLASIDQDKCIQCGICTENCRFQAIGYDKNNGYFIDELKCEGCRLCERLCPESAVKSHQSMKNKWYISDTRFGNMIHADLAPGEENSGKLVTVVRQQARKIADKLNKDFLINDGPPGIGCSTIASVTGTDAVLLIVEPSLSGLHDLQRLNELVSSFKIPQFAIINKYDINVDVAKRVKQYLQEESIPLLGELPFQDIVVNAMVEGKSVVERYPDSDISNRIRTAWNLLCVLLKNGYNK